MNRYSMPAVRLNGVGLTMRCTCAYSQPDSPAYSAAIRNTHSASRAVSTPMLSAMARPPASARIARPCRLSSRLRDSSSTSSSSSPMKRSIHRPSGASNGGRPGTPPMPL